MAEQNWSRIRGTIRRHCLIAAGIDPGKTRILTAARIEISDVDDVAQECTALCWQLLENNPELPVAMAIWRSVRAIGRISRELAEGSNCEPAERWECCDFAASKHYVERYGRELAELVDSFNPEKPIEQQKPIQTITGLQLASGRPGAVVAESITLRNPRFDILTIDPDDRATPAEPITGTSPLRSYPDSVAVFA